MNLNKKIVIILATILGLSWLGNLAFYFSRKIEGPVFLYTYVDSYKTTINLSYVINQYDKDKVVKIVLPELNDAEFYNSYVSSNINDIFYNENNQNEDIYLDGSAHYKLVDFAIDLQSGVHSSGEEYNFDDIYTKGVNITKIKYIMESGKIGECSIGDIRVDKIEEDKESRGYDLVESNGSAGSTDGYKSKYDHYYLAKDDLEIVGFKESVDTTEITVQEVRVNEDAINKGSFPIKVKKGDQIYIEYSYEKIPFYLNCDVILDIIIRDPEGTEDTILCGSISTMQETKNVTIKEVDKLLEMRGFK